MLKRAGSIVVALLLVFVFVFGAFASEAHAATTGFVNQNGTWVFMKNGSVDKTFAGFAIRPDNNKWYYAKDGKMDLTYTGLAPSTANNGKIYYANKGVLDWSYTGLVAHNGKFYAVVRGMFDPSFTGIIQHVSSKKWYFVRNGIYDPSYTGISKCVANTKLYYVKKGQLDWTYTGLVKFYDKYLAVVKGVVDYTCTGIIQNTANGNWHYVKNGVYDKTYTGLAKCIINNKWYHITNGYLNWSYTGPSKCNGNTYYVVRAQLQGSRNGFTRINGRYYVLENGKINYAYKGIAKNNDTNKYAYASNGVYDSSYTGIAEYPANGKLYYVKNGKIDTSFSGTITSNNTVKYTVSNGVATTNKYLEVTGYGVKKLSDGSTIVQVTMQNVSSGIIGCPTAYMTLYDKNKKVLYDEEEKEIKRLVQAMVAVLPGQFVTIDVDVTEEVAQGAAAFSIKEEGWIEQSKTIFTRIWRAPGLVSLARNSNTVIKAPTMSSNNSINGAKTVSFGRAPKVAISGLKFDTSGSSPKASITIENTAGKTITNFNINAAILDSKGNIIDCFMMNDGNYGGITIPSGKTVTLREGVVKWNEGLYVTVSYYSYDIGSTHYEWYLPTIPKAAKK